MRRFLSSVCLCGALVCGAGIGTAFAQGATSYITNSSTLLPGGSFNISGTGTLGGIVINGSTAPTTITSSLAMNIATANGYNLQLIPGAAQGMVLRSDGGIDLGNAVPVYYSSSNRNWVEVDLSGVGGGASGATNGEENEGLNVLASAQTGSNLAIALRGRINVTSATAVSTRGVCGVADLSSGGTIGSAGTGGLTGGYFYGGLLGGTVTDGSLITGVAADVDNTGGVTTDAYDEFIGGRFGANPTTANTFGASPAIGMFATASGSSTSNTGAFGAANITSTSQLTTFAATLPSGFSSGIVGLNPSTSYGQYAGYFGGNVGVTNTLTIGTPSQTGTLTIYDPAPAHYASSITQASLTGAVNYTIPAAPTGSSFLMVSQGTGVIPTTATAGTVLTNNGSGGLTWATPTNGVKYDVTSQQATATTGTDNLFNVGYASNTNTAAAGAVINSNAGATSGSASATGMTLTATASSTGAVATTGLNASVTGNTSNTGSSNFGIVATSNTTSGQLTTLESGLSTESNSTAEAVGASILAYNPNDGDHQYAGYFAGNNSNQGPAYASGVLRVINTITAAIPGNNNDNAGQPTAGFFSLTDNNSGSGASNNQAAPITLYAEATGESSPYTKVTGVFGHAWSKSPSGQTASGTMARAVLGFADGENNLAATGTKIIGVMGWTNGETSSEDNLLSVVGVPYPGMSSNATVPTQVGGYFFGNFAHTTNLGSVGQVGGSADGAWQDAGISGKNVAVVGINYNTASSTNLAGYFGGNVEVTGAITSGTTSNAGSVVIQAGAGASESNTLTSSSTVAAANTLPLSSGAIANTYAGTGTLASGTVTINITGVLSTDYVVVSYKGTIDANAGILSATAGSGHVVVTSNNGGDDNNVTVIVVRP